MEPDLSTATSLLIVKPSSLGDVVHTIPAVSLLAAARPGLSIHWLVNPEWAPLVESLPWVASAIPFPRQRFRGAAGLFRFLNWRRHLQAALRKPPDAALDFQGLLRSGLACWWSRAPMRIGMSDSREGSRLFHSRVVAVDRGAHAVDRYLAVVQFLGVPIPAALPWELPRGTAIPEPLLAGIQPERAIVLHPFSRGEGKAMSPAQVMQFCSQCPETAVILVGRGEKMPGLPANVRDLTNRTSLEQLVWLMRRAGWIVSVDSGPMHIAAAANPRVLGIHTWSDPCKVGPYRPETWIYKGGRFFHRDDCPPTLRTARCVLEPNDISRIADFAMRRMAGET